MTLNFSPFIGVSTYLFSVSFISNISIYWCSTLFISGPFLLSAFPSRLSAFLHVYRRSFTFISVPSRLSAFLHVYQRSFTFIGVPSRLSAFLHVYRRSFTFIGVPSRLSAFLHVYQRSFTFISFPSRLSAFLHVYQRAIQFSRVRAHVFGYLLALSTNLSLIPPKPSFKIRIPPHSNPFIGIL